MSVCVCLPVCVCVCVCVCAGVLVASPDCYIAISVLEHYFVECVFYFVRFILGSPGTLDCSAAIAAPVLLVLVRRPSPNLFRVSRCPIKETTSPVGWYQYFDEENEPAYRCSVTKVRCPSLTTVLGWCGYRRDTNTNAAHPRTSTTPCVDRRSQRLRKHALDASRHPFLHVFSVL